MKTIKQVADEIGVSKQRVYRYIKNHISDVRQGASVMQIDDAAETRIKQYFLDKTASHDAHHDVHQKRITDTVDDSVQKALLGQLEEKDKQIEKLIKQLEGAHKLIDQQQQLQLKSQQQIEKKHKKWPFRLPWVKKPENNL